jgi:hypothetical protein
MITEQPKRKRWQPDPRDLADHREWKRKHDELAETWRVGPDPSEIPPTDDAPVSALEPFGVDAEVLGILYTRIPTVGDARRAIAHPEDKIGYFGPQAREAVSLALSAADRWLAENPPVAS